MAEEARLLTEHPDIFHEVMLAAMRIEFAKLAAAQNRTVPQIVVPLFTPTVWKRAELGLHSTVEQFRTTLEQGGNQIGTYAGQIFVKTPLATEKTTVDLFRATGRDLGLVRSYTFAQLLVAAAKHNLGKLPAEAGPALRESYTDQPLGEVVWVCMDPIAGSDSDPPLDRLRRGTPWGRPVARHGLRAPDVRVVSRGCLGVRGRGQQALVLWA